jgi:hypothetical protein
MDNYKEGMREEISDVMNDLLPLLADMPKETRMEKLGAIRAYAVVDSPLEENEEIMSYAEALKGIVANYVFLVPEANADAIREIANEILESFEDEEQAGGRRRSSRRRSTRRRRSSRRSSRLSHNMRRRNTRRRNMRRN